MRHGFPSHPFGVRRQGASVLIRAWSQVKGIVLGEPPGFGGVRAQTPLWRAARHEFAVLLSPNFKR